MSIVQKKSNLNNAKNRYNQCLYEIMGVRGDRDGIKTN